LFQWLPFPSKTTSQVCAQQAVTQQNALHSTPYKLPVILPLFVISTLTPSGMSSVTAHHNDALVSLGIVPLHFLNLSSASFLLI